MLKIDCYKRNEILNLIVPEIQSLNKYEHQNIVKYYDYFVEHWKNNDEYDKYDEYCNIILEYCEVRKTHKMFIVNLKHIFLKDGYLDDYLMKKTLNKKTVLDWFNQIVLGISYLHNRKCVLTNLKPS